MYCKKVIISLLCTIFITQFLFSQTKVEKKQLKVTNESSKETVVNKRGYLELDIFLSNKYPFGDISNFEKTSIGGGIGINYTLPILPIIGFGGKLDVDYELPKINRIENWFTLGFEGVCFLNFKLSRNVLLRPNICYGILLHNIVLDDSYKLFIDQTIQIGASLRFTSLGLSRHGIWFYVDPNYTLLTERTDAVHYLGYRAGISYNFK